ncbi:DUF4145 domain-containing protein [Azospirillaceae bacterium]
MSPPGSNDLLIRTKKKAVRDSDGTVRLVGDGKKTIDRFEIEETFKQLQFTVDLSQLKRLADIRNDIEHMHPTHAPALIQEAIADAMPIIRDVIVRELHEEPSALLGQAAWDSMLEQARMFKAEQDACRASFDAVDWNSDALAAAFDEFRCPLCSSTLLRNNNVEAKQPHEISLVCSKCGEEADAEDVIEAAVGESLSGDAYVAMTDGGDCPLENCPECDREIFIVGEGRCANCGFSLHGYECAVCCKQLSIDDYRYGDGNLCNDHHYVMSKDD